MNWSSWHPVRSRWLARPTWSLAALAPLAALVGCGPAHNPPPKPYQEEKPAVEAKRQRDQIVDTLRASGPDKDQLENRLQQHILAWTPPAAAPMAGTPKPGTTGAPKAVATGAAAPATPNHGHDIPLAVVDPHEDDNRMATAADFDRLKGFFQAGGQKDREKGCFEQGCFYDLDAELLPAIGRLVHQPNGPLHKWRAWRYLSGRFDGKGQVITLVILDERARK